MRSIYKLYLYLIILISITIGIFNSQFVNDGYHWGFIYANSMDILYGKKIYKEIFLEYGLLQSLINYLIIKYINDSVLSIQVYTIIIYSLSFLFIFKIVFNITNNDKLSFLSVLMIFIINPWAISPWPIYHSFFFTTLFVYFFLKNNKFSPYLSGLFLFFSYLSYTTLYNFILLFLLFILLSFIFIDKFFLKKNINLKLIKLVISFVILFFVFLYFLIHKEILMEWLKYQKIPFLIKENFNLSFVVLVIDYIDFIIYRPFFNLVYEPQWLIYSLLFISNIFLILIYLYKIFSKKEYDKINYEIFIILLFILSLNIIAQVKTFSYVSCSLSLSIIPFAILFKKINNKENQIIIIFILSFITIYSLFNFDMKFSKYAEDRYRSIKHLYELENKKLNQKKISYLKYFKLDDNYWNFIFEQNNLISNIKKNCKNINGVNLTEDTYLYLLIGPNSFQKVPFYLDSSIYKLNDIFDSELKKKIQYRINDNSIFLITNKNNEKNLTFNKHYEIIKIYKKTNKIIDEEFRIIFPKKCN